MYDCECLDCGHKISSEKHCKDITCPECGGEMRRESRPGVGKSKNGELYKELLNTKSAFDKYHIDNEFKIDFKIHKKTISEEEGFTYVKGYACTSDKDWVDDIITSEAMDKSSKDLLRPGCKTVFFNHDEDLILGSVVESYFDGKGIFVSIKLSNAADVDSYRTKVQEGILSSFSIRGFFKTIEVEKDKDGYIVSWKVLDMDLMEVSLVGLPCNKFASVVEVIEKAIRKNMSSFAKKVGKKTKNSGNTQKRKVKTKSERSQEMADKDKKKQDQKSTLIREIVEEHMVDIVNEAVEDAIGKSITPMKEQVDKVVELVGKTLELKTKSDEDEDEDDEDEEPKKKSKKNKESDEDEESKKEETPEWAKSLADAVSGLNEKFADLEKETSKRKGHKRDEDEDEDGGDKGPVKALKSLEDEATIHYVKHLIDNGEVYDALSDGEKKKAKAFMFCLINEASKSKG